MSKICRDYFIEFVTGDFYGAEFVRQSFVSNGIRYERCKKSKSDLYHELIPILLSGEIELLDDETIINQLSGLERRTRSGGKDRIDHGPNQHDDVANCIAGLAVSASKRRVTVSILY